MARAGDLNKRITLQLSARVSNGAGGFNLTWSDHATVWAALWPVSANEQVKAMQPTMTITHRVRIWYRSKFSPTWRLKYGNRHFNIISIINPGEKNEVLDLLVKEVMV